MENTQSSSKITRWSLVIGIIITLNLFFNYAITLVYKAPEYDAYFTRPQVVEQITTREACVGVGGQWTEDSAYKTPENTNPKITGYCDPDYTKRLQYDEARKIYEKNVFITLVVLGVITLILGILFPMQAVLAPAFSWGGVLSLIIASVRYWSMADNLLKVIILAVALGALIFVAIRKFGK